MSEKVRLPKSVCDALDFAKCTISISQIVSRTNMQAWTNKNVLILNLQNSDTIMRALVLGYEPELTTEEEIKELFKKSYFGLSSDQHIHRDAITDTLRIHGIHYDWLEGDAE